MKVKIGETGELIWSEQVDLCPDALYLRLTGKKPEDIFPSLKHTTPPMPEISRFFGIVIKGDRKISLGGSDENPSTLEVRP